MRAVVAYIVVSGCGFSGAATNGVGVGDAKGPGTIDSPPPALDAAMLDALVSQPDAQPDALVVDAPLAMIDAASPDAAPAPYRDCLAAYQAGIHTDGPQQILPPGAAAPFTAFCNMTTAPGGWTLVAGYTFTSYGNFMSGTNAITPRPAWPLPSLAQSVPISTTVPTAPGDHAALDYALWMGLGPNFLIESNVNNWLSCTAGTGGLAPMTAGTISCSVAKVVTNIGTCANVAPAHVLILADGPILDVGATFGSAVYYFEGSTGDANWPTHDPCGTNAANQLGGVPNPGGAIFLHR